MAKRRDKGFQWVREDQRRKQGPASSAPFASARRTRPGNSNSVRRLAEVPRGRWHTGSRMKSSKASNSTRACAHLRGGGLPVASSNCFTTRTWRPAALAGLEQDQRLRALERWRDRLVAGDDSDLQAFIEDHPAADRQRLRALLRQARGEGKGAAKAMKAVFQELKAARNEAPRAADCRGEPCSAVAGSRARAPSPDSDVICAASPSPRPHSMLGYRETWSQSDDATTLAPS